ncbi:MAG: flagellar motor protein MotA [Bacteroidetes bacterium]|nr:flagellar motor protein MotA [Bacteroidota bacterium]
MKQISLTTILGFISGFGLFMLAIVTNTDNYLMFLSFSSFIMVIGGTLASAMVSFSGSYVIRAFKELFSVIVPQNINTTSLYHDVALLIQWSKVLQRGDIRDLEKLIDEAKIEDSFMKYATNILVSGYSSDELRPMLTDAIETRYERNMVITYIIKTMGNYAPAFGMIGTLVGLIIMLDNLGANPDSIGSGMALALMTTLYGVLFSQLILKPGAEKTREKQQILRYRDFMVMEGLVMLNDRKSAIAVQDRLNSFLDPKSHFDIISENDNK